MSGALAEVAPRKWRTRFLERVTVTLATLGGVLLGIGCAPESKTRPALQQVIIREMRYEPASMTVAIGDTVAWINRDLVPHTATAQSREWDSGSIEAGASWRTIVRTRGPLPYACVYHPGMQATLLVQ